MPQNPPSQTTFLNINPWNFVLIVIFSDLYFILSFFWINYVFISVLLLMLEIHSLQPYLNKTNLMKTTKMNLGVYKCEVTRCVDCSVAVYLHLCCVSSPAAACPSPQTPLHAGRPADTRHWPSTLTWSHFPEKQSKNVQQKPQKSHDLCQSGPTHMLISALAHRNTVSAADVWLLGLRIQTRFLC